jgi:ankyrin repeat protein
LEFVCQNGWDLNSTLDGGNQYISIIYLLYCLEKCKILLIIRALHLAASLGSQSEEVIRLLIEHGAQVNALNSESKTALFVSVEANNPLAASTLLSYNADHTIVSNHGTTAFENIKDIDEWVKLDMFGNEVKSVLESKLFSNSSYH